MNRSHSAGIAVGLLSTELVRAGYRETLGAVRELGVETIQLNLGTVIPGLSRSDALTVGMPVVGPLLRPGLAREIESVAKEEGVVVAAVDGTFNMCHPDPSHREAGVDGLARVLEIAAEIGIPIVTLSTGTRATDSMWRPHPENSGEEAWKTTVDVMERSVALAEQAGVTLAFEPEINNVVSSAAVARRLLDTIDSPYLKVLMDPANIFDHGDFARMDEVLDDAFALLGGDVVLAHAKDVGREGDAGKLPAGLGRLDYAHYARLLAGSSYHGALILHALTSLPEIEYPPRLDFVRGCVEDVR